MTSPPAAAEAAAEAAGEAPAGAAAPRRPRKIFLLIGTVLAAALAVGLFTGVGTRSSSSGPPRAGDRAPTFSLPAVGGSGTVGTPGTGGGNGTPAVLLFFGNWCPQCHAELPGLAAAVRAQQRQGGPLAKLAVIGVDSLDHRSDALAFTRSSGVTFPVAFDPVAAVTNGLYYFTGDPEAVFVAGDGTITAVRYGPLAPATFTQLERRLVST